MRPVRALVAGDQKVVRDGLCLMLGLLGIEVTGAAGGTDAVRQAAAVPTSASWTCTCRTATGSRPPG
jgi:CheY-like chemotaxis protein